MTESDDLHDQGEAALANQQTRRSSHYIYSNLRIGLTDVGARMMLGAIEKEKGNLEIAADHLASATVQDPEFTEALLMLSAVYALLGAYQRRKLPTEESWHLTRH